MEREIQYAKEDRNAWNMIYSITYDDLINHEKSPYANSATNIINYANLQQMTIVEASIQIGYNLADVTDNAIVTATEHYYWLITSGQGVV